MVALCRKSKNKQTNLNLFSMKVTSLTLFVMALVTFGSHCFAQTASSPALKAAGKNLYIDVHQLEPGKVKFADVANAHAKISRFKKSTVLTLLSIGWMKKKAWCTAYHLRTILQLSEKRMPKHMDYCRSYLHGNRSNGSSF